MSIEQVWFPLFIFPRSAKCSAVLVCVQSHTTHSSKMKTIRPFPFVPALVLAGFLATLNSGSGKKTNADCDGARNGFQSKSKLASRQFARPCDGRQSSTFNCTA